MRLMQNFEDKLDNGKLYYEPVRLLSIPKRIAAWIRVRVWGFCPKCNSDAPELYDCPVCEWNTNSPFGGETRKLYWNKWKLIDFKIQEGTYIYIPRDLDDCLKELDKKWDEDDKGKAILSNMSEEKFIAFSHHGYGQWMRNNWGLWTGSRLARYFNRIGIDHADDMSGIILTSYHRRLNNKLIDLDKQIKEYQDYWKSIKDDNVVKIKIPERLKKKK